MCQCGGRGGGGGGQRVMNAASAHQDHRMDGSCATTLCDLLS